jgi:hypothetical protein
MKTTKKLAMGIGILILFCPLGLLLPEYFRAGDAWGEWGLPEIKELVGYVPRGLEKLSGLWPSLFKDYSFSGWQAKGLFCSSLAYIFSAILGVAVTLAVVFLIAKLLTKKGD